MCFSPLGGGQSLATQLSSGFLVPRKKKKKISIHTSIYFVTGVTGGIQWQKLPGLILKRGCAGNPAGIIVVQNCLTQL